MIKGEIEDSNATGDSEELGIKLFSIPAGTFQMGSNESDDEKPVHTVNISSFMMSKYEVTVANVKQFINETSYQTDADNRTGGLFFLNKCQIPMDSLHF